MIGVALGQAGTGSVAAGSPAAGSPAAAGAANLSGARGLAAKGKLDAALVELEVLAAQSPEEAGVERLRGEILYQKERLPEAGLAFARAVQQDVEDKESRTMLGLTLYRLGRPVDAIPLLEGGEPGDGAGIAGSGTAGSERAGSVNPGSPSPGSVNPGSVSPGYVNPRSENPDVGHPGGGADTLGSGLGSGLSSGLSSGLEPRYVLGLCYTDVKRYDDARRAFAAQFGFGADSAEAYLVTARLFLRREFADEAEAFARKALEIRPGLPGAHQLLGEVALAKADLPRAVAELEGERQVNPLNGAVYDRLGDAYLRNGQFAEAREALDRAVLLEPNATGPYILLGETLVKIGEPIQALHYLQRALAMDANNSVTHHALGEAYRALGQMEEANRELRLAVSLQHK